MIIMKLYECIHCLIQDKKLQRKIKDKTIEVYLFNKYCLVDHIYNDGIKVTKTWELTKEDLEAEDWECVEAHE